MNLRGCFEILDLYVGSPPLPGAGTAMFETLWSNHTRAVVEQEL